MNNKLLSTGFLVIPNFINKDKAVKLGREFKDYAETNNLKDDAQVLNSKSYYNYISFLELLCEKITEVSFRVGENVLPTYTYSRVYKKNNVLKKHFDKKTCEVSITLHLYGDKEWLFYLKDKLGSIVSVNLNPGDALLYLGNEIEHWREEYQGEEYVQCFLHYVLSRGKNSNLYFDNSNNLKNTLDLSNFIKVYENIVDVDLCDFIINEYKDDNWKDARVGGSKEMKTENKVRNCCNINISNKSVIDVNIINRKKIDDLMFRCSGTAIQKYITEFPELIVESDYGYNLLRYQEGGFYIQHTDSYKKEQRAVSCSFCLNDNYEGGEFAFFNKTLKFKLKKGSVIMFPSNFMFPHEILQVTKGTRYSIVTWFI